VDIILTLFSGLFLKWNVIWCQEAKEKFQQLQKVISILGDAEKRALYDETGIADDDVSTSFLVLDFLLFRLKQYFSEPILSS